MSEKPDGQVVIAPRDGVLVRSLAELLEPEQVKPSIMPDQLDLVQLFVGILGSSRGRILLILDGELWKGSKGKKRKDLKGSSIGFWEADAIIDQHISAYESASLAERNAELALHLLTLFEDGQITPYISMSDDERTRLAGWDFDDVITFVSESESEEPGYWATVIREFLHPKIEE